MSMATKSNYTSAESFHKDNCTYFDTIDERLLMVAPKGNWFSRSNGDELLVVLYENEDSPKQEVIDTALSFIDDLSIKLYQEINEKIEENIVFDIGVTAGACLTGIFGGRNSSKADISSPLVGRAKRFESEAKRLRSDNLKDGELSKYPIVVMQDSFFDSLPFGKPMTSRPKTLVECEGKNIDDVKAYVFHPSKYWDPKENESPEQKETDEKNDENVKDHVHLVKKIS